MTSPELSLKMTEYKVPKLKFIFMFLLKKNNHAIYQEKKLNSTENICNEFRFHVITIIYNYLIF